MTSGESIPIRYTLVEQSELVSRATAFQILSEAEYGLLRCFMALLQLPASTDDLSIDRPPFVAATSRVWRLPSFRKAQTLQAPPQLLWEEMKTAPLMILMVGSVAPAWLEELAAERDVGVLTSSETLSQSLRAVPRVHVGVLKGVEDLRESYRVLGEMILLATDSRFGRTAGSICPELAKRDIFRTRLRLDFIPGFPLPSPDRGRPAAYLLNRLSNNVDAPALLRDSPLNGLTILPSMLDWCTRGCAALALLEMNEPIPAHLGVSRNQLETCRTALTSSGVEPKEKFDRLLALGHQMTGKKPIERPFFVIPVPRHDLVKGKGPESVTLDPHTKREIRAAVRAVKDFTNNRDRIASGTTEEKRAYARAWRTLETEERLISCQTAWLSAGSHSIPIQMSPLPGVLRQALDDLNSALETNSRKITELFQSVEMLLAQTLPTGLLKHLNEGNSPVLFFSDLPLEWTMLKNWPVCLTRPVSRIPIGFSHWDVLNAVLDRPAGIDTKKPERVLVFALIEEHDPIKSYSDSFISTSEGLGQKYTYVSPKSAHEFVDILTNVKADVVVLDVHGGYSHSKDQLFIEIASARIALDDLLPDAQVPPVWILSACHTSVSGAMRGCFVRGLLGRGAVCVVASLSRVDAFTASMFVGPLLTEIFNPFMPGTYHNFHEVFFSTQYTTALLYDPLLPFFRLAQKDPETRGKLSFVLSDTFRWTHGRELEIRKYRHEIAWFLGEAMLRHGLQPTQLAHLQPGIVRPETLLFSIFGVPAHVELK